MIRALVDIVGWDHVDTDEESRERLSFDAVTPWRLGRLANVTGMRVEAVARPADTRQVAQLVGYAITHGTPIIPYGGGTGVMGAVVPTRGGFAMDLRRMDRILEISREDRIARVQPGVYLADLDAAANHYGLILGHDPWSVSIATVGGAISTDSVGYRASKYGSMGQQVRALEVVLGTGQVVRTRPMARQSSGPLLNGLLVGAEGTMGVITEATIQLHAEPEAREFASIGFDSFEQGYPAVVRMFDIGLVPAMIDLTEELHSAGISAPCILYLGFEGYREEVNGQIARSVAEAIGYGGKDLGPEPTAQYWATRHSVAERWRRDMRPLRPSARWERQRRSDTDYLHITIAVSKILEYKRFCDRVAADNDLEIHETAIWTHPELFSVLVHAPDTSRIGRDGSPLWIAVDAMLEKAIELGGGIEYCHGMGTKLDEWAEREWGKALPLARLAKGAVDPKGILNPGKLGL